MLRLVTAATAEPVSLPEAKRHLAVLHDADDALIEAYITAAREVAEQQTGYAMAVASYEWTPVGSGRSPLPIEPGVITSADDEYPVLFTTAPGALPGIARSLILLLLSDLYANREATVEGLTENPAVARLAFLLRRVLP